MGRTTIVTPYQVLPVSWQLAQLLVIPVWFMAVPGPKAMVVKWQTPQSAAAGIWLAGRPSAVEPLWQEAQVPSTWVWSTVTGGFHTSTEWHAWHESLVAICVLAFPVAVLLLWQETQLLVMPL